jgi:hypothetical protein
MDAFDRAASTLRPFVWWACVAAVPIFFVSYVYCLKLLFDAVPNWLFLMIGAAHIIVWFAAACLHDYQQESRSRQQSDQ